MEAHFTERPRSTATIGSKRAECSAALGGSFVAISSSLLSSDAAALYTLTSAPWKEYIDCFGSPTTMMLFPS